MHVTVQLFFWILTCVVAIPAAVFSLECLVAAFFREETEKGIGNRPSAAVLIPAHNEEAGIEATIRTVKPQLLKGDRLVVIADNSIDATAIIAKSTGVEVVERVDAQQRGKGYAIDFGIRYLALNPPDVVVIVDADCSVHPNSIDVLVRAVANTGRPAQAVNLLDTPLNPSSKDRLSAFAFRVKNLVRPLGLRNLGWPCPLSMGNAFPWRAIRDAPLASGNIVEDMQLGIDLTIAGFPPLLCTGARVTGRLPQQCSVATGQRRRWEHGHLQTIAKNFPRLIAKSILTGRPRLVALLLDLSIPPFSLLVIGWMLAMSAALLGSVFTNASWLPAIVLASSGAMMFASILVAWARFARELMPLKSLLAVPFYVTWKLPLYASFLFRRQKAWVRTAR